MVSLQPRNLRTCFLQQISVCAIIKEKRRFWAKARESRVEEQLSGYFESHWSQADKFNYDVSHVLSRTEVGSHWRSYNKTLEEERGDIRIVCYREMIVRPSMNLPLKNFLLRETLSQKLCSSKLFTEYEVEWHLFSGCICCENIFIIPTTKVTTTDRCPFIEKSFLFKSRFESSVRERKSLEYWYSRTDRLASTVVLKTGNLSPA